MLKETTFLKLESVGGCLENDVTGSFREDRTIQDAEELKKKKRQRERKSFCRSRNDLGTGIRELGL